MAVLSVVFKALDEMSAKFDAMSNAGDKVLDKFDNIESKADSALSQITDNTREMADVMARAEGSTASMSDTIDDLEKRYSIAADASNNFSEVSADVEEAVGSSANALEDAVREYEKYEEGARSAADGAEEFGDKSVSAVSALDDLLMAAGIVTALHAIGEGFAYSSEKASEYEKNLAMVTTVADQTVLSEEELSRQITSLSKDIGKSVNEISDATYNAISAGIDTADAVSTIGEANKLAEAGFTSNASALSVLTTALNSYKLDASEVANISDSLVVTQNLGVLTIDNLAGSMGKAISTASAYAVDLQNLEASYISLTKSGISVEESTTYISSMLNELGDTSSEVSEIISGKTGKSFGQLMKDGYSLADVLGIVYDSVEHNSEAMMNLWGSAEAGKASNAIINQGLEQFNVNLNTINNSSGITEKAFEKMTNTAAFGAAKMDNSLDNLAITIGSEINPIVNQFKLGISESADRLSEFLSENEGLTSVLIGTATGLATVTAGVGAVAGGLKLATLLTTSFGGALTTALGPIGLAALAVGAATAAVVYFADTEDELTRAQDELTTSSKAQYEVIEDLTAEYDALVDAGEADTVAAYALKNEIAALTETFEMEKQTIGDLIAYKEQLASAMDSTNEEYEKSVSAIEANESGAKGLIAQLYTMAESADLSGSNIGIMSGIVDKLNSSYGNLNLTLDETTGKLSMSLPDLWEYVSNDANSKKAEANIDALLGYLEQYQTAQEKYHEAQITANDAYADYQSALDNFSKEHPVIDFFGFAEGSEMNYSGSAKDAFSVYEQAKTAASGIKEEFDNLTESIRNTYLEMGYTTEEVNEMMNALAMSSAEAINFADSLKEVNESNVNLTDGYAEAKEAINGVYAELEYLCEAYDNAYAAAQESVHGQFELWNEVKEVAALSSESMNTALQSQIDYWNSYNANMEKLSEKAETIEGLKEMLDQLADGSTDSAAMLAGLANVGSDEELEKIVKKYSDLQNAQSETAKSMADLKVDFDESLTEIQAKMDTVVESMDMSAEAKLNAKSTIDAYIREIESGVDRINSAWSGLKLAKVNLSSGGYHEYASGTDNAEEGLALVGEEGPELIDFSGGEKVYTASETSSMLSQHRGFFVNHNTDERSAGNSEKTITLKIEGGGEMKINGNTKKEDILDVINANIKDVLLNIIQQEVLEEGEMSYEF